MSNLKEDDIALMECAAAAWERWNRYLEEYELGEADFRMYVISMESRSRFVRMIARLKRAK